jgi:hypothetical protein
MTNYKRAVLRKHEKGKKLTLTDEPFVIRGGMDDWPAKEKWNPEMFCGMGVDKKVEIYFGNMNNMRHNSR